MPKARMGVCGSVALSAASALLTIVSVIPVHAQDADSTAPVESIGQPESTVPDTLHYGNGYFEETYVPYSKSFWVVGGTQVSRGDADLVRLTVELNGTTVEDRCWFRPSSDLAARAQSSFGVLVGNRLRVGREYDFELGYFERASGDDFDFADVGDQVTRRLFNSDAPADADATLEAIRVELNTAASDHLTARHGADSIYHVDRVPVDGRCPTLRKGPPVLDPDDQFRLRVQAAVDSLNAYVLASRAVDSIIQVWGAARLPFVRDPNLITSALAPAIGSGLVAGDTTALRFSIQDGSDPLPAMSSARFVDLLADTARTEGLLGGQLTAFRELVRSDRQYRDALTRQQQLLSEDLQSGRVREARDAVIDDIARLLTQAYFPRGQAQLAATTWEGRARSRALRVSVSMGSGIAGAGFWTPGVFTPDGAGGPDGLPTTDASYDIVTATMVRYHPFGEVDKSLPDAEAYSKSLARLSIDAGFALKAPEFHGREMQAAGPGFHPLVGLGYDLNPDAAVHVGFLLFDQPSTNPLSTSATFTAGGYFMVAYDLNLFNWVKGQFPQPSSP